ncbi:uncharacterized protein K444DRAFT_578530 [Hyaloscypha bicolor E]|uniref:Extracellular membrane protein CFEM domain-containing protein n=1 Tax=Hyaloscypha bicolor E TaxID=1095630 RepID=A0A2J6TVU7_9HELO|nr:uncharacterized protein K444DRAFT_578530 [Hyaloscypha bicolor E]PMD67143.1 hypothetical protein K444DRAFT_578530 [Hyaloscypha bicolor E]
MKQLLYCFLINGFVTCAASQDLQTVSIADRADFKVLRPCIHTCLFGNGDVAPGDGCGAPWYNQCWCSSINIVPSATRYISTCIPTLCSDSIDVATGIDIYYDYCSKAGFPIPKDVARPTTPPQTQTPATTQSIRVDSPAGTSTTLSSTVRTASSPTSSSTPASSPPTKAVSGVSSSSSLSNGETAGIVIGVFALLLGIAALWYQRRALAAQLQHIRDNSKSRRADSFIREGRPSGRRGVFEM